MNLQPPFPRNVPLAKARLVVNHPSLGRFSISLQYNPETFRRSVSLSSIGLDDGQDKAPAYRGAGSESFTLETMFESTPPMTGDAADNGVLAPLAALELLLFPPSRDVVAEEAKLDRGIRAVVTSPLPSIVLEWGQRAMPVRLTQLSVSEEMFDAQLNPIRAVVTMTFNAVTYSTTDSASNDAQQFLQYQKRLEQLARPSQVARGV